MWVLGIILCTLVTLFCTFISVCAFTTASLYKQIPRAHRRFMPYLAILLGAGIGAIFFTTRVWQSVLFGVALTLLVAHISEAQINKFGMKEGILIAAKCIELPLLAVFGARFISDIGGKYFHSPPVFIEIIGIVLFFFIVIFTHDNLWVIADIAWLGGLLLVVKLVFDFAGIFSRHRDSLGLDAGVSVGLFVLFMITNACLNKAPPRK